MRIATVEVPVKASGKTELVEVSWWSNKDHPFWSLAKPVASAGALWIILSLTASHFDASEIKAIVYAFIASVGIEGFGVKRK